MAELKSGKKQFNFVGKFKRTQRSFALEVLSNSGYRYNKMNIGLDVGEGNTVFADSMGGYSEQKENKIYVHGVKKREDGKMVDDWENRFEIQFDDRENEDLLEQIGDMCFVKVGIVKDTEGKLIVKKFLSNYDVIQYVFENIKDDMILEVRGTLKYSIYNDNLKIDKEIKSIFLSKVEKEEDFKAEFIQSILLDRKSIGKADTKKNIIPLSARVIDYNKDKKKNVPYVVNYEFPFSNDQEKERQSKMLERFFKVSKDITEIVVIGKFVESIQLINIEDINLDEDTKFLIAEGIISEEEVKRKAVGSEKKERHLVIVRPDMRNVTVDDETKTEVAKDEGKYTEADLIVDIEQQKEPEKQATQDDLNNMLDGLM